MTSRRRHSASTALVLALLLSALAPGAAVARGGPAGTRAPAGCGPNVGASPTVGGWTRPVRVVRGAYQQLSAVVDDQGRFHVAAVPYSAGCAKAWGGIDYITGLGSNWSVTHISESGADSGPTIALDANGKPHIVFMRADEPFGDVIGLWEATNAGGGWRQARLTRGHHGVSSLRVRGTVLHLAFLGGTTGSDVLYGTGTPGAFTSRVVARSRSGAPSLRLDDQGNAHIGVGGTRAAHITNAGGSWRATSLTDPSGLGARSALLVLDRLGAAHIAWQTEHPETDDFLPPDLYYAQNTSGAWSRSRLIGPGGGYSLSVDYQRKAHLSVVPRDPVGVFYWTNETANGAFARTRLTNVRIDYEAVLRVYPFGASGKPVVLFTRVDGDDDDGIYLTRQN